MIKGVGVGMMPCSQIPGYFSLKDMTKTRLFFFPLSFPFFSLSLSLFSAISKNTSLKGFTPSWKDQNSYKLYLYNFGGKCRTVI